MSARAPLHLLACSDAVDLAAAVGRELGVPVSPSRDVWFACGEGKHVIEQNIRGSDVYIFQRPVVPGDHRSVYDRTMMLLHAVDAARLADADRVTVVLPYLPGSRQDKRKNHVREGITTGLFARMLEAAGVSMVITVEPHDEAIMGCFDPSRIVLESVDVKRAFARFLQERGLAVEVVASTDVGGLEAARGYAQLLGAGLAALSKERDYRTSSTVVQTTVIGDVRGRSVLVMDDIIDTAGSMVAAVQALWEQGATDILIGGVHPLMSRPAWARLKALRLEAERKGVRLEVVGTTGILHPEAPPWYHAFPIEPLLADVVRSVNTRGSVRAVESR